MIRWRFLRVSALTVLVVVSGLRPALAQDRTVLFLHGFRSGGSDWNATAARLHDRVAIEARTPDLAWRQPYEQQAQTLRDSAALAGLASPPLAIGHSNGGLVARELSRLRRVDGIATIGTPHRGAPILPGFSQWMAFQGMTAAYLGYVVQTFGSWSAWSWTLAYFVGSLSWISDFSIWSVAYLGASLGLEAAMPVTGEMAPGSAYLATLNAPGNLQREASDVPARVGVVSVAHNFFFAGPARAITPAHADEVAAALYSTAFGFMYWSSYIMTAADPADIAAIRQASSLMGLAGFLLSIDPAYCTLVSGAVTGECFPNDGVVPVTSQEYPGAPNIYLGMDNDGPAHSQEKDWGQDALYDALVWYMHVPPRPGLPPGPPAPAPGPSPAPGPAPAPQQPDTPSPGSDAGLLRPDEVMWPDTAIESADGRFHLIYQGDGNLVLYDEAWSPMWATGTQGSDPGAAVMQSDGNFVVYDAQGVALWASSSSYGHPGAWLLLQSDGNLVIYDVDGTPLWATDTAR
jgi:hypothetical protein